MSKGNNLNEAAFVVKNNNTKAAGSGSNFNNTRLGNFRKKERSYCTHCNIHVHSIDKCYTVNGYPPGFKSRSRENFQNAFNSSAVNQLSTSQNEITQQPAIRNFAQNLNSAQYQQLMSMLSTYLASSSNTGPNDQDSNIISSDAGICYSIIFFFQRHLDS